MSIKSIYYSIYVFIGLATIFYKKKKKRDGFIGIGNLEMSINKILF